MTGAAPRVALVAHGIHDAGGMERSLAELVRRTHEQVAWVLLTTTVADDVADVAGEVHLIRVPTRPVPCFFSLFYAAAARALPRLDVDLRHAMGALQPHRVDIASVQFCHAAFAELPVDAQQVDGGALRSANRALDRWVSLRAERRFYADGKVGTYLPASDGVRRELERHYRVEDAVVVPNGVESSRFDIPRPKSRAEVLSLIGATDEATVAVFLGGDWVRKGLGIAIEAVALARSRGADDLRLLVIGRGDVDGYRAQAADLGIPEYVTFAGPRADPATLLVGGDIFLFPTAYEAFPLVAIEAAAAGLSIVATQVNGIEDLVTHGESGYIVDRTPESAADALLELCADAARRARLAAAARERSRAYSWETVARRTLQVYERVLSRGVTVGADGGRASRDRASS